MAVIVLINGDTFKVKETVEKIVFEINSSGRWVKLTVTKNSLSNNPVLIEYRFMIRAIAYWY